jgi:hypothetical protein
MDKSKREKGLGPGKYELDPSLQIKRIEDLPKAIERTEDRVKDRCACPMCGTMSPRTYTRSRKLYDIGDLINGRPCRVTSSNGEVFAASV